MDVCQYDDPHAPGSHQSNLVCCWIRRRGLVRLPPAEGVEHVEEGDHHVDEDYQGEQGVCKEVSRNRNISQMRTRVGTTV